MNKPLLLDCTLRDGGYYTNWDFDKQLVDSYITSLNKLPVDFIEIGYRSTLKNEYFGEYYYCPLSTVQHIKSQTKIPLAIMLDAKNCKEDDADDLLSDLVSLVDLVRIAVSVEGFEHGLTLARCVKDLGFKVALNIMRSTDLSDQQIIRFFGKKAEFVDFIYLVDSYGSIFPKEIVSLLSKVQKASTSGIGFHGHNNLELAFTNSIEAMEGGINIIDFTVLGMGRGAGNLKTELFLTFLKKHYDLDVDLNVLGKLVQLFSPLKDHYQWGGNLAYITSGAFSLPQKDVMEALDLNRYSLPTIVNRLKNDNDNELIPLNLESKYATCLVVGGGSTVRTHLSSIKSLLKANPEYLVVHATSKFINEFDNLANMQFAVVSGDELLKIEKPQVNVSAYVFGPNSLFVDTFINAARCFAINSVEFIEEFQDSPLAIGLQIGLEAGSDQILLVGFDGYEELKSRKELYLMNENQKIIDKYSCRQKITALTPSKYSNIDKNSIYWAIYSASR
tara:strand:- start:3548 stop:5059 length:1512 start_codon:yes stop_codon:yes gene_type:complete